MEASPLAAKTRTWVYSNKFSAVKTGFFLWAGAKASAEPDWKRLQLYPRPSFCVEKTGPRRPVRLTKNGAGSKKRTAL